MEPTTTTYSIEPHVGAGPVKLGMKRDTARAAMLAMGHSHEEDVHAARDLFHSNSFQVFYDRADLAEYIELSRSPDFKAIFKGEVILELPADDAVRAVTRFAEYSSANPELGWSYIFPALDLSLWRPATEGDEARTFRTIGAGRVGYYANL